MPEKDFNLLWELTHEPKYLVRPSDEESIYIYRDVDEQLGIVRWIVEYYDMTYPQDNWILALTYDISSEPESSEVCEDLREPITDKFLNFEDSWTEWNDFYHSIKFIPWEKRHEIA